MSVLIIAPYDNGGQGIALKEALNMHTSLLARCLTINQSYLQYDTGIVFKDHSLLELRSMLTDATFFIFSEHIPIRVMKDIGLLHRIHKSNTVINTGGSYCRNQADTYLLKWVREGFMFTGGYTDWSLVGKIGRIAFTKNILPIHKIPDPTPPGDGKIRIAFAPTKKEKGVDEFNRVAELLVKKYPDTVEMVPLVGKPWRESIQLKSTCDITFDQFLVSTYANSAIESMYLEHAVLSRIDGWTRFLFPDLPIVDVNNERQLYDELCALIESPKRIAEIGKAGKEFVLKHHDPRTIAKQWETLIEFVRNGM